MTWSKTRIDQLGNRLRSSIVAPEDLELLEEYRLEFAKSCAHVTQILQEHFPKDLTARPAKSTRSITDKLKRESIRLSQMQDVAGCRVVVDSVKAQDDAVQLIAKLFEVRSVLDRRQDPSAGYRAVHIVVVSQARLVEVQVRTVLQDRWAGVSETLSDALDPTIKYGGGSVLISDLLGTYSRLVAEVEGLDRTQEHHSDEHILDAEAAKVRTGLLTQIDALEKLLLNQRRTREDEGQP